MKYEVLKIFEDIKIEDYIINEKYDIVRKVIWEMEELVEQKFSREPFKSRLFATGNAVLDDVLQSGMVSGTDELVKEFMWRIVAVVTIGRYGIGESFSVEICRSEKSDAMGNLIWENAELGDLFGSCVGKKGFFKEKCLIFSILNEFYKIVTHLVKTHDEIRKREGLIEEEVEQ